MSGNKLEKLLHLVGGFIWNGSSRSRMGACGL